MLRFVLSCTLLCIISSIDALKLTLKQDLSQLQEQLSPEEMGQFLHTIKDLPKLSEYLDPIRSPVPFDLLHYYNEYGCNEIRVFDMTRIRHIMSYGNLSREDKLLLLNGNCIQKWPGLLKIPHHDLNFFLNMIPESNPLLQVKNYENLKDANIDFNWSEVKKKYPEKLSIFLDIAARHREEFHFIPCIDKLFRWKIVSYSDFDATNRINLIGPIALDECIEANMDKANTRKQCIRMILSLTDNNNNFSERDLFYWSLNILTAFKYNWRNLSVLNIKGQFSKLFQSCRWHQVKIIAFLKDLEIFFIKFFETSVIDNEIITKTFRYLCKLPKWQENDDEEEEEDIFGINAEAPSSVFREFDSMMMAIEFYTWLVQNSEIFGVEVKYKKKWLLIIHNSLTRRRDRRHRDYFMEFLAFPVLPAGSSNLYVFRKFVKHNYSKEKPSMKLLKVFKRLSWINCWSDMVDFLKNFLPFDLRINLLRRLSFDHRNNLISPSKIEIYVDETTSFGDCIFNGVFNSLLDNELLVHPLEIDITASPILWGMLKDKTDLKSLLPKFWILLGSYNNGFVRYYDDSEDIKDGYSIEYLPLPWTHPNVLLAIGCVMTLALLHGIKLTGWALNRELFDSIFEEINLAPIEYFDKID